jgi:ribosome recycling factor
MMVNEFMEDGEQRMKGAILSLASDMDGYRTGRASPRLLDQITIELYGAELNMNQVAVVSVPEPQQLAIRPFDANTLSAIERAIMKSDLGLNPNNDGKIIRLNMPRLTEQRRRDLSRLINKRVEEGKVAVRNVRRDVMRDLRDLLDEKMISEDEYHRATDQLQELTNKYTDMIDAKGKEKTEEIMEV